MGGFRARYISCNLSQPAARVIGSLSNLRSRDYAAFCNRRCPIYVSPQCSLYNATLFVARVSRWQARYRCFWLRFGKKNTSTSSACLWLHRRNAWNHQLIIKYDSTNTRENFDCQKREISKRPIINALCVGNWTEAKHISTANRVLILFHSQLLI